MNCKAEEKKEIVIHMLEELKQIVRENPDKRIVVTIEEVTDHEQK